MRAVFLTMATLGMAATTVAMADPPAEQTPTTPTTEDVATPPKTSTDKDCSTLEGDAKTACEAEVAKAKAETEKADKSAKGGKAKRSNTNRMERVFEDE